MGSVGRLLALVVALGSRCTPAAAGITAAAPDAASSQPPPSLGAACGGGHLRVHFYDVGAGLAALVDLPDGRHVLVDAGDRENRRGCRECRGHHAHLLERLAADLGGSRLALVWITHPHSDHVGGAASVLERFGTDVYVDNGRDQDKAEVAMARRAALAHGGVVRVVDPDHREVPLASDAAATLRAIVPAAWPTACATDPNECSIGLRVDACGSSILFMGDAEQEEERTLDVFGPVSVLQVAHHGSATSTSPAFLSRARPRYVVVSTGGPAESLNREYCHPRALIVRRLTRVLGGAGTRTLESFDGDRCDRATAADWVAEPSSDRLWATERDGDVVLSSAGAGVFVRER